MGKILFNILLVPILYLISFLPFPLLYLKSYGLYLLVYYVIGYRKAVVRTNLKNSFPELNEKEIERIMKQFYLHFCDTIFETIKLLSISPNEFKKRFKFSEEALKVFMELEKKQQSFVCVLGHCGNWEWTAVSYQIYCQQLMTGVYHPLSNKSFDQLMLKIRSRFGGKFVPMQKVFRELLELKNSNTPIALGLIADQSSPPESSHWTMFLNQETPVFNGPEKIARKFNYPVVFAPVKKTKRGYYELNAELICSDPSTLKEGEISALHVKALERTILDQPFNWLWTHRRWKHKRPNGVPLY